MNQPEFSSTMPYQPKPSPSLTPPTTTSSQFHYYTLAIINTLSPSSDVTTMVTRQLITFPSQKRKQRFLIYLRDFCQARRRGDSEWAVIPGNQNFEKALEYAVARGCCVYDLKVERVPVNAGGGRKHVCAFREDCQAGPGSEAEEEGEIIEEDITDMHYQGLSFLNDMTVATL